MRTLPAIPIASEIKGSIALPDISIETFTVFETWLRHGTAEATYAALEKIPESEMPVLISLYGFAEQIGVSQLMDLCLDRIHEVLSATHDLSPSHISLIYQKTKATSNFRRLAVEAYFLLANFDEESISEVFETDTYPIQFLRSFLVRLTARGSKRPDSSSAATSEWHGLDLCLYHQHDSFV